jgi:hypothetical protein
MVYGCISSDIKENILLCTKRDLVTFLGMCPATTEQKRVVKPEAHKAFQTEDMNKYVVLVIIIIQTTKTRRIS